MHNLDMMKKRLCKELDDYAGKQSLSHADVIEMRDLAQAIHYFNKVKDHDEMEDGASMRGNGSYRGTYEGTYNGSYDEGGGGSYRRGRDSMGRFTSRDMGPRGNAREYGSYDDQKAHIMSKMEKLSRKAQNDPEMRRALDECMDALEQM